MTFSEIFVQIFRGETSPCLCLCLCLPLIVGLKRVNHLICQSGDVHRRAVHNVRPLVFLLVPHIRESLSFRRCVKIDFSAVLAGLLWFKFELIVRQDGAAKCLWSWRSSALLFVCPAGLMIQWTHHLYRDAAYLLAWLHVGEVLLVKHLDVSSAQRLSPMVGVAARLRAVGSQTALMLRLLGVALRRAGCHHCKVRSPLVLSVE